MDTGRQNTGVFSAESVRSRGRTGRTMAHSPSFVGWWDGHARRGGDCTDYGGLNTGQDDTPTLETEDDRRGN